jgi:hypothetical protein
MPDSNFSGYAFLRRAMVATVGGVTGIYVNNVLAPLAKLVDTNTTVPGGSGDFTSFGNPIASVTYIEFTASYSSSQGPKQGIFAFGPYLLSSNFPTLYQILASGTVAPDSDGAHFVSFSMIGNNEPLGGGFSSFADENIPFIAALDDGQSGLFCTTGVGTSVKILDTGDSLDGKTVSSIQMSPEAAGQVFTVFEVGFTDGSSGIYYFDTNVLPEPASLGLFALPALLMLRRR